MFPIRERMKKLIGLSNDEIVNKWLSVFASSVPNIIMKEHIIADYNHLWHIFTWGNVPCVIGNKARNTFDSLSFDKAIMFCGGYSMQIENIQMRGKITSLELDELNDVYVVDKNFEWTYVHTHEIDCGPYFCRVFDLLPQS
jgi:hypothetical protein